MSQLQLKPNSSRIAEGAGGAIVSFVIIAAIVFFNLPGWDELAAGTQKVPPGMAYIQGFELYQSAEVRVSATEKDGKPISVYYLSDADHRAVQSGNGGESILNRINAQSYVDAGQLPEPKAKNIGRGIYHIYFENTGEEEGENAEDMTVTFKIEVWQ